jgi:hypothetical protein
LKFGVGEVGGDRITNDVPRDAWERAFRLADDDMLKMQLANNLCFFYLAEEPDNDLARTWEERLLGLIERLKMSEDELPAFVVDTVIWAEYTRGGGNLSEKERRNLLQRLTDARGRAIERVEEALIIKHIDSIEHGGRV